MDHSCKKQRILLEEEADSPLCFCNTPASRFISRLLTPSAGFKNKSSGEASSRSLAMYRPCTWEENWMEYMQKKGADGRNPVIQREMSCGIAPQKARKSGAGEALRFARGIPPWSSSPLASKGSDDTAVPPRRPTQAALYSP